MGGAERTGRLAKRLLIRGVFLKLGPTPGTELVLIIVKLFLTGLADQGELFSAVGTVGKSFKKVVFVRGKSGYFLSALAFVADFLNDASIGLIFRHLISRIK
jgi:hypothetical protein